MSNPTCYEAIIVGSGFSGTLLGWILAKRGWKVAIIDKASHPRFAVGESSTPTADFLLAYLADRWDLPEIRPLAAYGTWKESNPELRCGKKRGFVYLKHQPNKRVDAMDEPRDCRMVAASMDDYWSDTQWMRADTDAYFAAGAESAGCKLYQSIEEPKFSNDGARWSVTFKTSESESKTTTPHSFQAQLLIDASGGSREFGEQVLSCTHRDEWMLTKTASVFGHFLGVGSAADWVHPGCETDLRSNFHVDDSAQHHVTDDGWLWVLRFDSGVTSVGVVVDHAQSTAWTNKQTAYAWWQEYIARYPSIQELMREAQSVDSTNHQLHSIACEGLYFTTRLSRCRDSAIGNGWISLPNSYGFIDPLHSSGIAHALSGVVRAAEILSQTGPANPLTENLWHRYDRDLQNEIRWLDLLVGGCYRGFPSFEKFCAFSAYYFIAAIQFERVTARDPSSWSDGYMSCDHPLRARAFSDCENLPRWTDAEAVQNIRRSIDPWNDVGLLDPVYGHRIPHTAPPKLAKKLLRMN